MSWRLQHVPVFLCLFAFHFLCRLMPRFLLSAVPCLQFQPVTEARGSVPFPQPLCHHVSRVKLSAFMMISSAQANLQVTLTFSSAQTETCAKPMSVVQLRSLSRVPLTSQPGFGSSLTPSLCADPGFCSSAVLECTACMAVPQLHQEPHCQICSVSGLQPAGATLHPPVRGLLPPVMRYIPKIQKNC